MELGGEEDPATEKEEEKVEVSPPAAGAGVEMEEEREGLDVLEEREEGRAKPPTTILH